MIINNEEFLTPTSFIQSTHNTVAGQIALLIGCHNYNFTYVHRGISFESALIDAMTQLRTGEFSSVLAGGTDELTHNLFAITSRLGFWKQKLVDSLHLLSDNQRGSIAGEGAAFLFLQNQSNEHTYARLDGVHTFLKPASEDEPVQRMHEFLAGCGLKAQDISLLILGLSGDPRSDKVYRTFADGAFSETPQACFKHLCGEYPTASAFATWAASRVIKTGSLPDFMRFNLHPLPENFAHVLIYNHYRENNHAFILLSQP
jgi:3-oxoacyl-(acyl-carrier-protein) synthase